MKPPSLHDVESAVRSVLAELRAGSRTPASRNGHATRTFGDRLLSLRFAESLPSETHEVRIAPGTVVTPLARDFLKRRGIAVRLVSNTEAGAARHRGEWGFALETESGVITALRRVLLEADWIEVTPSLEATARWVLEVPHRGALFLTDEASVAVWKACQFEGIRAATALEPDAVARAVRRLGMNLLVVEPAGKPIALLRQLGQTFRKAGAPEPPEGLDRGWEGLR